MSYNTESIRSAVRSAFHPPSGRGHESVIFASPNQHEMNFTQAQARLSTPEHQAFKAEAARVMSTEHGRVRSAIGDWKDGAEDSTVSYLPTRDPARVKKIAAHLGAFGNQRSVLTFRPASGTSATDRLWHVHIPGRNLDQSRTMLDQHHIAFRTLLPTHTGTHAIVFDQGGALRSNMREMRQHGATVAYRTGVGEYIGDDDRAKAQTIFHGITGGDGVKL